MNNSTDENTNNVKSIIANTITLFLYLLNFLVGTGYVLLILIRKNLRSNRLNWLTANVCLTTALLSVFEFLVTIFRTQNWFTMSCRLEGFLLTMCVCQMMYAHCVSSFNRLLAIRYFHKLLFRSCRWLLVSMGIGWIVATLLSIPTALLDSFTCAYGNLPILMKLYNCMIILIIPVGMVTICNASIFQYIRRIGRRVHDINNNKKNNNISRKRDAQVSKIMLITFGLFVIGWTPIFCQSLFITDSSQISANVTTFLLFLLLISLLGDMILLIYANQPVRQLIKEKLNCNGKFLYVIKC